MGEWLQPDESEAHAEGDGWLEEDGEWLQPDETKARTEDDGKQEDEDGARWLKPEVEACTDDESRELEEE